MAEKHQEHLPSDNLTVTMEETRNSSGNPLWIPCFWGLPVQFDDFPVPFDEKGRVSRYNLIDLEYIGELRNSTWVKGLRG